MRLGGDSTYHVRHSAILSLISHTRTKCSTGPVQLRLPANYHGFLPPFSPKLQSFSSCDALQVLFQQAAAASFVLFMQGELTEEQVQTESPLTDALHATLETYERGIYSPADHSYVLAIQKRRNHTL